MSINRFNFRAYIKPYNKIYKVQSLENDGTFMAVKCFEEDGKTILKRNDNRTDLPLFTEGEFELMQSTGLVDKNGKEIFEGDIVNITKGFDNFMDEVFYDEELCSIRLKGYSNDYCDFADWIREGFEFEVIGNIYENPELLKS